MTLNQIRNELKDIRYYYARQSVFDKASLSLGKNAITDRIEVYNEIIKNAPPRIFDLYVSLYMQNHTQESLGEKLGYSIETISRLNNQLLRYLLKEFEKKGDVKNEEN